MKASRVGLSPVHEDKKETTNDGLMQSKRCIEKVPHQ
uniref:Uncharacterized protein n=1 Tax=Setaria italica TaxID=4555 RepID=K4ANI7_SETIT